MNLDDEPKMDVHLTEALTVDGETFEAGLYTVYLCMASHWLARGKAHLCNKAAEIDQAGIVNWMNQDGLTLGQLANQVGLSKGMLSQVMSGKKKLSRENLIAIMAAYDTWLNAQALKR